MTTLLAFMLHSACTLRNAWHAYDTHRPHSVPSKNKCGFLPSGLLAGWLAAAAGCQFGRFTPQHSAFQACVPTSRVRGPAFRSAFSHRIEKRPRWRGYQKTNNAILVAPFFGNAAAHAHKRTKESRRAPTRRERKREGGRERVNSVNDRQKPTTIKSNFTFTSQGDGGTGDGDNNNVSILRMCDGRSTLSPLTPSSSSSSSSSYSHSNHLVDILLEWDASHQRFSIGLFLAANLNPLSPLPFRTKRNIGN